MPLIIEDVMVADITIPAYGRMLFGYKVPSVKDRPSYLAATAKEKFGSKGFWEKKGNARLAIGLKYMEYFKIPDASDADDYIHWKKDGADIKFSSNKANPHYTEEWKVPFKKYFAEFAEGLGTQLMDGGQVDITKDDDEPSGADDYKETAEKN